MMTKRIVFSCMVFLLALFCSCFKRDRMIICTQEYRMLTVSVLDSSSNPVLLDDYFLVKTATGEIIDFSSEVPYFDSINRLQGIYLIGTDGMMGTISRTGTEFTFHGKINTTQVVNEKYLLGHDDCHILLLSGKPEIIIP